MEHGLGGDLRQGAAGRKILEDTLAPLNDRTANLNTQDNVDLVDALKGLFNDTDQIAKQYREGYMGRTAGFDFVENTLWPGAHARRGERQLYGEHLGTDRRPDQHHRGDRLGHAEQGRRVHHRRRQEVHPETKANSGLDSSSW